MTGEGRCGYGNQPAPPHACPGRPARRCRPDGCAHVSLGWSAGGTVLVAGHPGDAADVQPAVVSGCRHRAGVPRRDAALRRVGCHADRPGWTSARWLGRLRHSPHRPGWAGILAGWAVLRCIGWADPAALGARWCRPRRPRHCGCVRQRVAGRRFHGRGARRLVGLLRGGILRRVARAALADRWAALAGGAARQRWACRSWPDTR